MLIWRVSDYADLSGHGGMIAAARWNHRKTPIVYCCDHPASSLLEMLVHIDPEDAPKEYQLLKIEVPDRLAIVEPELPADWRDDVLITRDIGSGFIAAAGAPILSVPSVIVPFARNFLVNPRHPDVAGIRIVDVTRHPVDQRLIGLQ